MDAKGSRELIVCMMGFGFSRNRLSAALNVGHKTLSFERPSIIARTAKSIERLHWTVYRNHGPFRRHCTCEWTVEVRDFMEAA